MELDSLAIKVARSENLPILPEIVSAVLRTIDEDDPSGRVLERIIERDPAIAAKILRAANSSYYGFKGINTVGRAVSVLGLTTVRSLVVGLAFQQMSAGRTYSVHFDKLAFWRHSVASATGSRIIAKMKMPVKAEELYTAGMLHDLGMLVLDRFCPLDFDAAIKRAHSVGIPLYEAERQVYGYNHADVGALLAEKWSLPPLIQAAIRYHHDVVRDDEYFDTTCMVAVAEVLAHQCGFNNNSPSGAIAGEPLATETVGLPEEQLVIIGKVMSDDVLRAQETFQIAA